MTASTNQWKTRGLSLLGRVQVIKAQALSLLQYAGNNLSTPKWAMKEINNIIYKFIWKGPDKIPREALETEWNRGGLGLPRPQVIDWTLKIQWLKRATISSHPWTAFYNSERSKMVLDMNRPHTPQEIRKLQYIEFNKKIVEAAVMLQKEYNQSRILPTSTFTGNRLIRGPNFRMIRAPRLNNKNVTMIKHLKDCGGEWYGPRRLMDENLNLMERMEWLGVNRILEPCTNRIGLQCRMSGSLQDRFRALKYELTINEEAQSEDRLSYKNIQNQIRRIGPGRIPARRRKAQEDHNLEDVQMLLTKVRKIFRDTRSRDFCYRLCNGLLYAARDMHKFNLFDSPKCPHCDEPNQTIEHLFWQCPESNRTYAALNSQGTKKLSQARRLHDLEEEDDPTIAYKLKVMHIIYINNITKIKIDAETVKPLLHTYIATAKLIAEERNRMPHFLRLWY